MAPQDPRGSAPATGAGAQAALPLDRRVASALPAARAGDREAIGVVAAALRDREGRAALGAEARARLVSQAVAALRAVEKTLGKPEYVALIHALDEPSVARDLEDVLGKAARGGTTAVLGALREVARAESPVRARAVQVLARVRSQLGDADYLPIAWVGLGGTEAPAATELIEETVREGKPAALAAVEKVLVATDVGADPRRQLARARAARLLCQEPERIKATWVRALADLASTGQVKERAEALGALGMAAARQPPVAGAARAFVDALRAIPPKVSFDRMEELRAVARTHLGTAFGAARAAGDEASMRVLAPHVMRRARDPDVAVAAAELLYPLVMDGDVDAIAALAETATRPLAATGEEACKLAVKMLEGAARAGQAEAVVQVLIDEAERRGQNDDERGLEALGRAARHLPEQHALLEPTRAALRRAVKSLHPLRTRGHLSALRGMLALAEHLRDDDVDTLLDHLGPQAGQVLAAAAPRLSRAKLESVRDALRLRLERGISVKGASAALEGIEPLLDRHAKARVVAAAPAEPVVARPRKAGPLKARRGLGKSPSLARALRAAPRDDDDEAP